MIRIPLGLLLVCALPLSADIEIHRSPQGTLTISNPVPSATAAQRQTTLSAQTSAIPYHAMILTLSSSHGIDPQLVIAVCRAESGFNPRAVSRKGAVGLMQLMPVTARQYAVTDRTDPQQNLSGGIRHLKYLLDKYQSLPLTLAAYNAGEEPVRKYRGIPPYRETQDYVERVMRFMGLSYSGMSGKSRIFMYRQPNGRILLTDETMPVTKGYQKIRR
jgi:hypothetical protein